MTRKTAKPYWEMTTAELREATKEFNGPLPARRFKPLTPQLKAKLVSARRKRPGRPMIGRGAQRVLLTIERDLLSRADAYAREQGMSRAQLVARGLRAVLSKAG